MKVYMITGDNKHSALRVAKHVGIHPDNVTYEAYPETKKILLRIYRVKEILLYLLEMGLMIVQCLLSLMLAVLLILDLT